jgi:hypothetical protein
MGPRRGCRDWLVVGGGGVDAAGCRGPVGQWVRGCRRGRVGLGDQLAEAGPGPTPSVTLVSFFVAWTQGPPSNFLPLLWLEICGVGKVLDEPGVRESPNFPRERQGST